MRSTVAAVHELVTRLEPVDNLEGEHRGHVLGWLRRTDDVYRRVKPAEPAKHLVSYVVPVDPADGSVLLVEHRNAGLWLPPGGHVEVGEEPYDTAVRELEEELEVVAKPWAEPLFLTVTETVGLDSGHIDVSLWYVAELHRGHELRPDAGEFHQARWWTPVEIAAADPAHFDPHLGRFLSKLPTSVRGR
ncbi:8-oxo-dGTP pyrophosphatase MutT (NUDIX family) [Actinoplanes campanulatus]|uniref:8-oxo-dGTP pyrophosphatase MutT (NUDIX family) n=1 Tax=Actinoplanes campanulatus TaxID=113559 RepID=A0A7W5FE74_9ACTN|nr:MULTISPECIES: NUDIX domain-containing protein [Actinoplanes]MBB3095096.1 8-oxo-dGTP pyrophosphatase MutT (NUDIX family) [Actinoplanes campanulatus]